MFRLSIWGSPSSLPHISSPPAPLTSVLPLLPLLPLLLPCFLSVTQASHSFSHRLCFHSQLMTLSAAACLGKVHFKLLIFHDSEPAFPGRAKAECALLWHSPSNLEGVSSFTPSFRGGK